MTSAFEFVLPSGKACRLEATYSCEMASRSAYCDGNEIALKSNPETTSSLVVFIDGKEMGRCSNTYNWQIRDSYGRDGIKRRIISGLRVVMPDAETEEKYTAWINSVIKEGTTYEVIAYEKEKEAKEKAIDLDTARSLVRKAEKQAEIPCREKVKKLMKEWNDIYNEGCEGYVPHIISREEYEEALEFLRENG